MTQVDGGILTCTSRDLVENEPFHLRAQSQWFPDMLHAQVSSEQLLYLSAGQMAQQMKHLFMCIAQKCSMIMQQQPSAFGLDTQGEGLHSLVVTDCVCVLYRWTGYGFGSCSALTCTTCCIQSHAQTILRTHLAPAPRCQHCLTRRTQVSHVTTSVLACKLVACMRRKYSMRM